MTIHLMSDLLNKLQRWDMWFYFNYLSLVALRIRKLIGVISLSTRNPQQHPFLWPADMCNDVQFELSCLIVNAAILSLNRAFTLRVQTGRRRLESVKYSNILLMDN